MCVCAWGGSDQLQDVLGECCVTWESRRPAVKSRSPGVTCVAEECLKYLSANLFIGLGKSDNPKTNTRKCGEQVTISQALEVQTMPYKIQNCSTLYDYIKTDGLLICLCQWW